MNLKRQRIVNDIIDRKQILIIFMPFLRTLFYHDKENYILDDAIWIKSRRDKIKKFKQLIQLLKKLSIYLNGIS